MTRIHCLTCTAALTAPDTTTANKLADANNWLPVKIEGVAGFLCEGCGKWINMPIRLWRDRVPEEFNIERL